ncbi:MAG TPA: response regulator transcription factor [Candidatus Bathyarchaeia archaeon]|nr:response regulator transcription factor [Candidatus Bathyarchaeia archaeon]
MIKVIIAAESALARRGVEQLLRGPGVEIVSSIASLSSLDAEPGQPDSADLIVATAEPAHFAALLQKLAEAGLFRDLPAVLLAEILDPQTTARALHMGARAVLPVELPRSQLLAALEAVARGFVVAMPTEAATIVAASQNSAPDATSVEELLEPLTPREHEVLRLLALGLANKEIAARLRISEHTVKFHVASILGKLGATSRTEAVAIGLRRGLVLL